jgi:hypothetical protein
MRERRWRAFSTSCSNTGTGHHLIRLIDRVHLCYGDVQLKSKLDQIPLRRMDLTPRHQHRVIAFPLGRADLIGKAADPPDMTMPYPVECDLP